MTLVNKIEKIVMEECNKFKLESEDNYDFWNNHIRLVYNHAKKLAKQYNANLDVVLLGALLHDIALIRKVGNRNEHHINGSNIAKEILIEFTYDNILIDSVCKTIYNHRSSKNASSIEDVCVADADILSHFDNLAMIFNNLFKYKNVSLNDIDNYLDSELENDFNDLSDKTKIEFEERYRLIRDIIIKKV